MNSFQKEKFPFFRQLFYITFRTIFFPFILSVFRSIFWGKITLPFQKNENFIFFYFYDTKIIIQLKYNG